LLICNVQTYEICYLKGHKLAEAGKPYEPKVWIIRHGKMLVYGTKTDVIYNLRNGDHFGEKSLFADASHLSSHDAVCETNVCAWVVEKAAIESVILDLRRLGQTIKFQRSKDEKSIQLKDLKRRRILGAGAFGKVWLVESKRSKTPYAMKVINKRKLLDSHQEKGVLREKELLSLLQHPFILSMVSSYQDDMNLYLLLPLIQGGELFNIVQQQAQQGRGYALEFQDAAFYAACIIEALGHFHHRRIAYRDLKLENVMVERDGYGKIVDLGFAKVVADKTYTFCGTPEYLAPEIIMSKGHDKCVDYWSFGVLLYELICGRSPFFDPTLKQMDMFKHIVLVHYEFPKLFHSEAKNLVSKLLVRKQTERLGNLANGVADIKMHAFFSEADISFNKLLKKQIVAPHKPEVKDPFDASNFDQINEPAALKELSTGRPLSAQEQELFKDF
jgi:protein kinase A